MSDYVLFQMWSQFRASLIEQHHFYVREARSRLLSRFDDIEADAEKAADVWLEESGRWFNPDSDDPESYYEAANDVGIQHYQMLSDMREQTRLSVVAGMYHQWDKQLRNWLVREIQHWHNGDNVRAKVWGADFALIIDLLESFGWPLRTANYFKSLNACRLVVNVYKHGEGPSLQDLKERYPEYLHDPFRDYGGRLSDVALCDHTALRVKEDQFEDFADAILAFWRDIPENVFRSSISIVPPWFEKAILKDREAIEKTRPKR
ncbi:MAG: hypothetical protein DI528_05525 [Shinella sp.]|nr:MAG: hypothetical protein DI528_05525 [Shinella sp.]